jgi:hypothetical protein
MTGGTVRRVLVVGCSRSGTTLLQGLLASHSRVHTFPETGVFLRAFGLRGVLPWARLGITLGKERKALVELLSYQQGAPGQLPTLPPRTLSLSRSLENVGKFLDQMAAAHGKDIWVEKTPRHVFHARRIRRTLAGSGCIHIIRRGEDVVASMVDRARRFPDRFPRQLDPAYGVRQWNRSIRATWEAVRDPGHAVVVFEDLVRDVRSTMVRSCEILGLDFEDGMGAPSDPAGFTDASEEWKSQTAEPVRPATSKFEVVFDEEARARITGRLEASFYDSLRERAGKASGGVFFSGSAEP